MDSSQPYICGGGGGGQSSAVENYSGVRQRDHDVQMLAHRSQRASSPLLAPPHPSIPNCCTSSWITSKCPLWVAMSRGTPVTPDSWSGQ